MVVGKRNQVEARVKRRLGVGGLHVECGVAFKGPAFHYRRLKVCKGIVRRSDFAFDVVPNRGVIGHVEVLRVRHYVAGKKQAQVLGPRFFGALAGEEQ